jgi:hypothetical protein
MDQPGDLAAVSPGARLQEFDGGDAQSRSILTLPQPDR